jgi:hypothetical protein
MIQFVWSTRDGCRVAGSGELVAGAVDLEKGTAQRTSPEALLDGGGAHRATGASLDTFTDLGRPDGTISLTEFSGD